MLKYVGNAFIPGVPARNLTDAEAERYDRAALVASGLYVETAAVKPPKRKIKKLETTEWGDESPEVNKWQE